jgi:hypothetical protein
MKIRESIYENLSQAIVRILGKIKSNNRTRIESNRISIQHH